MEGGHWEDRDVVGRTILEEIFEKYVLVMKTGLILPRIESSSERLLLWR